MIKKILIANRGEIACRIVRTAHKMGIKCVGLYSDADCGAVHTLCVDEAVYIGPSAASQSYLNMEKICTVAKETGADAVHPGYGFLSENPEFPDMLAMHGIHFIGPAPSSIRMMADKVVSKKIAKDAGVTVVPGYMGVVSSLEDANNIAESIGYPVMIKAVAGGGGKGMRIVRSKGEMEQAFVSAGNEATKSFSDCRIFIEKYIDFPRHIEIQILADKHGNVVCLGERECSIQRNNQKVIEETPSPYLDDETRSVMYAQCVGLAEKVNYFSAGTVEFIVDKNKQFYFLEMNTRLQVEHPVTELVTGLDLVEQMIRVANGERLAFSQDDVRFTGSAIEARIYAEDPRKGFLPSSGRITHYHEPTANKNLRIDSGVTEGSVISMFYDPMIAKVSTHAENRLGAIEAMKSALSGFCIEGIANNIDFLLSVFSHKVFVSGNINTGFIAQFYKSGFKGDLLTPEIAKIFSLAVTHIYLESEARHYGRQCSSERVLTCVGDYQYEVSVKCIEGRIFASFGNDDDYTVISGVWRSFYKMLVVSIGDVSHCIKVRTSSSRYILSYLAVEAECVVHSVDVGRFLQFMPVEEKEDVFSDVIISPIAGMVVDIYVKKGDKVAIGQSLLTIEAMKMENLICSEVEAEVEEIRIPAGSSVNQGDIIIKFVS